MENRLLHQGRTSGCVATHIHQNQSTQCPRLCKGQGQQELLQLQADAAYLIDREAFCALMLQRVDIVAVRNVRYFALDPAVTVQNPVASTGRQGLLADPSQLQRDVGRGAGGKG